MTCLLPVPEKPTATRVDHHITIQKRQKSKNRCVKLVFFFVSFVRIVCSLSNSKQVNDFCVTMVRYYHCFAKLIVRHFYLFFASFASLLLTVFAESWWKLSRSQKANHSKASCSIGIGPPRLKGGGAVGSDPSATVGGIPRVLVRGCPVLWAVVPIGGPFAVSHARAHVAIVAGRSCCS